MIILELKCGLGNQLFEYAFARALKKKLNEDYVYLDLNDFENEPDKRSFALGNFSLPTDTIILKNSMVRKYGIKIKSKLLQCTARMKRQDVEDMLIQHGIYSRNFEYDPRTYDGKVHYLRGIFQNRHYFDDIVDEIKNIYQISSDPSNQGVSNCLSNIMNEESVCVHIRRGDYVSVEKWSRHLQVCTENYYCQGMEYVKKKVPEATFYVFSNTHEDIEWIKNNYHLPYAVTYVDMQNTDIDDFRLMMNCKHFVISNSSFSWWSQYLCENKEKIVVAPSFWDTQKNRYSGIYMDFWKLFNPWNGS